MLDCKCRNCNRRTINCHINCEDYKDYVRRNEKLKKKKKAKKRAFVSHDRNALMQRKSAILKREPIKLS